ncbi:unnamed protein product, partial [Nesidiocoris tenuis]
MSSIFGFESRLRSPNRQGGLSELNFLMHIFTAARLEPETPEQRKEPRTTDGRFS